MKIKASIILILLFASTALNQTYPRDVPMSEELYEILQARKALIAKALDTDKNEWSGVYQAGDHHHETFMWSATAGFLTFGGDHMSFARINFGKAEFINNRLILKPEIEKDHVNYERVHPEYTPVKWGTVHFLVPSTELTDFAYGVNSGDEGRIYEYYVKVVDYEKPLKGLPDLPKEYRKIMTMRALRARIITVKKINDEIFEDEITLDRGRLHNVGVGMIFYYANRSGGGITLRVTGVQDKTSNAKVYSWWSGSESGIEPKIGLRLSSKKPKSYIF